MREKDRGGRTRWRRGGEGRGGEAKSNAATPDGRPLSRCGGEGDGRRGRGRVGNGWGLGLGMGRGRRRGHIRLGPGGVVLGRRGEPGCLGRGRSLAPDRWQARGRPGGAGRPLEWPGRTGPRSFWRAVPCRPAGRTGGPSTAWCTGRAWPGPGDFGPVPCLGRAGSSVLGPG